ncbi:hypothetical protein pdam_00022036 [Pocillopora damicornis]|uniref:Uncharacterized protein n=1 Tax=Pocillopora damicornis TaxID=46731 RepID=A0A3M6UYX3_POCDA|nr:hypothetical protein pdam_00022036 [Pocillopora damicornis]
MLLSLETIMRLTRHSVLDVLKGIHLVIHTIVPENYRFWKSNQSSVCKRPIALEIGPQVKVLALVELLLHQPVDVNIRREVFKDAGDLCFINGVVFVAERGSSAIRFIELKGEVLFKPGRLKSRADLLSQLSRYRSSSTEAVDDASEIFSCASRELNKQIVQINPPLNKSTSICVASKDILLCADDEQRSIMQLELE